MGCIAQQGGDSAWQHANAGFANDEPEALQQASHLVLQIATQIDQLAAGSKQGTDLSALHALDLGFAVPPHAEQLSQSSGVVPIGLVVRIDRAALA